MEEETTSNEAVNAGAMATRTYAAAGAAHVAAAGAVEGAKEAEGKDADPDLSTLSAAQQVAGIKNTMTRGPLPARPTITCHNDVPSSESCAICNF
jgi:hypothetical protein